MKEIEELLRSYRDAVSCFELCDDYNTAFDAIRLDMEKLESEILARFSALEAKVKELETKNTDYKHAFDLLWEYCVKLEQQNAELKDEIKTLSKYNELIITSGKKVNLSKDELITELKRQVEDLKCCGNCKSNVTHESCIPTELRNDHCTVWQSDRLTQKEREG